MVGQATLEVIAQEEDFGEGFGGFANACRDWARELVVGKSEVPGRCGPKVIGEMATELIVVDENHIQIQVKELRWNWAAETVEPEVKEHQLLVLGLGPEHFLRELTLQFVVTEI